MNQLVKPTKKILSGIFGIKNVSVKNGQGTAWGWVDCYIQISKPINCTCVDNEPYCDNCRAALNAASKFAENATKEIPYYTYSSDEGQEYSEQLIQVSFNN